MTALERLYRRLLVLYPAAFREEYGSEVEQAFRDRGAEARHGGWWGRFRLGVFLLADLARSVPRAHWRSVRSVRRPTRSTGARSGIADWFGDVRFAVRGFARRPGFYAAAVITLGLGVGASTTVFSVADGVVLSPLPYPDAGRLVAVGVRYGPGEDIASGNPQDFFDLQRSTRTLEYVAASRLERLTLTGVGDPLAVQGAAVSPSWFDVLRVRPSLGRAFTETDVASGTPTAVLSDGLWRGRFGGDAGILGRALDFDGRRFTVVGVMPRGFHPPEGIYQGGVEIWYPLSFAQDDLDQRNTSFLQAIGRLAPGVPVAAADAEMGRLSAAIAVEHPESDGRTWSVEPLRERTVGDVRTTLFVLLAAVGLVLLISCVNVANLFLVRATERGREMALRTALGARRGALVRLLFVESLVLTCSAAFVAVALAWAGVAAFRATNPGDIPRLAEITVDVRVLGFALIVSLLTGIVFALVPALGSGPAAPSDALRDGAANVSASRRKSRLRGGLVIAQTAIALVLLAGAGLLIHSFVNLRAVDPGFDPSNAVWMQVRIASSEYESPESRYAFFTDVLDRFGSLPGVEAVGGSENMPMGRNSSAAWVSPEGIELAADAEPPVVEFNRVTDGFFDALRTPILRGREFEVTDDAGSEPVAIVSEALASRFWPGRSALGRRVKFGRPEDDAAWLTVVGVAADLHQRGLGQPEEPELYIPWRQSPRTGVAFIVRSRSWPATLLRSMRDQVWEVDPTIPLEEYGTLEAHVGRSIIEPRFYTLLLSVFASLALVLAFVGLYGTMAYAVERRTREIGVRMALGARPGDVVRDVIARGMLLTAVGLAIGITGALAGTRLLGGFMFGITPRDPLTLGVTALTLVTAALLACWLPARRAARLDPASTLRMD